MELHQAVIWGYTCLFGVMGGLIMVGTGSWLYLGLRRFCVVLEVIIVTEVLWLIYEVIIMEGATPGYYLGLRRF